MTMTTFITITIMGTRMTDASATAPMRVLDVMRLQAWLSPAFPTGSFAYSHGLETACAEGRLQSATDMRAWIESILRHGAGRTDGILCAHAWRAGTDDAALAKLAQWAGALSCCPERRLESFAQGRAFLEAAAAWGGRDDEASDWPLCVAAGSTCARAGVALDAALAAYLQSFATALVQALQRLGRLGQRGGVALIGSLEGAVLDCAREAARADLEELGGCAFISDIMAMRHATLQTRVFRS